MIVDPDFCDHWKTRMLVGALDGDEAAPVYVIRLWSHCQNRRQCSFANLSAEALKALCRFPGSASVLESAMVASGFVRRDGKDLTVCNWDEYNSALIAAWSNGKKGGRPSKGNREKANENEHEKPMGFQECESEKPTGSREEKSREEESREEFKKQKPVREKSSHWNASEDFRKVWLDWVTHIGVVSNPLSEPAEEASLYKLERFKTEDAIEAIRYSLQANAKNLILNGDHKRTDQARGSPSRRKRMGVDEIPF